MCKKFHECVFIKFFNPTKIKKDTVLQNLKISIIKFYLPIKIFEIRKNSRMQSSLCKIAFQIFVLKIKI